MSNVHSFEKVAHERTPQQETTDRNSDGSTLFSLSSRKNDDFFKPCGSIELLFIIPSEGFPISSLLPTFMNLLGGTFDRENRANAYPLLFLLVPNI